MTFHHTTLDNGLEIIAELNDRAYSVAAGFFVKTGSRDETSDLSGVSHFLEHMTFKGTPTRDALAVNKDFDRVGAKHNAQTSEEDTFYHVTCLPEYLTPSFDVLADILRPTLREDDFDTEKKVIIEEIKMYLDNPMSVAYEAAKAAHFGGHPLGNSILGTVESIKALKIEQMRDYFAQRYSPANIVLGFAGKGNWENLVELATAHCAAWRGGPASRQVGSGPWSRGVSNDSPPGRPAADGRRRLLGSSPGDRRPLRGPSAGNDPRRSYGLAPLLGLDRPGPRRRGRALVPGLQPGRRVLHVPELRAGLDAAQPRPDRRVLSRGHGPRGDRRRAGSGQEQGAGALGAAERAPMGRLASLGFNWMYRRQYLSIEDELAAFSKVTREDLSRVLADWPLWPMTIVSVGPTTEIHPPE